MNASKLLKRALASAKGDAPAPLARERALAAIAKATVPSAAVSVGIGASVVKVGLGAAALVAVGALGGAYAARASGGGATAAPTVIAAVVPPPAAAEAPATSPAYAPRPAAIAVQAKAAPARVDHCESVSLPEERPAKCSAANGEPVLLEIVNTCSAAVVDLYWVDYQCKEIFYNQLASGATWRQGTFANHPWRVRDHATHRLLKEIATLNETVIEPVSMADATFEIGPGSPTAEPENPRCSEAGFPIHIDVVNRRTSAVEMFRADEDCKEIFKGRVEPGDTWGQRTQTAHRWHARDAVTHALLKDFAADMNPLAEREYVVVP